MYPYLFQGTALQTPSFAVLGALGVGAAIFVVYRLSLRYGENGVLIARIMVVSAMVGVLGSHVFYIFSQWSEPNWDPLNLLFNGGTMWYGGPAFGIPCALILCSVFKVRMWRALDIILTGVVFGQGVGRIGCFLAGCCHGKPTDMPWAVTFNSSAVPQELWGVPVHPTQIYESIFCFLLFFALLHSHRHKRFEGEVSLIYFLFYAAFRGTVEIVRGDPVRGFVYGSISTSQFLSLALIGISAPLAYLQNRRWLRLNDTGT